MGIPIVGIVDSNSNPEGLDYVIPGNDDSIRSIALFTEAVADACMKGSEAATGLKQEEPQSGPAIVRKVETIEVDVFNVLGVSVHKTKIDAIGRLNDLDVSMLSSGVYTVRVRMITGNNEEIINVQKLIKK